MRAHVGQPQRPRVGDQHAEHAAAVRQVADLRGGSPRRCRGEEPLEALPPLVEHADRRVARAGHLARRLQQALEHGLGLELRDQRPARLEQPPQLRVHPSGRFTVSCGCVPRRACRPRQDDDRHRRRPRRGPAGAAAADRRRRRAAGRGRGRHRADAERLTRAHRPSVLVLDLNMRGESGLDAIPRVREAVPDTAIVVLTMQDDPGFARQALQSGALGFVLKEAADEELLQAIHLAAARRDLPQPAARSEARHRARRSRPARRTTSASASSRCCA